MKTIRPCFCVVVLLCSVSFSAASPHCCDPSNGLPILNQIEEAEFVLLGHFENAKPSNTGLEQGHADLIIEHVFKPHEIIKGKKSVNLPRYITDPKAKFIVFCDVYKGKINAYKGTAVVDEKELARYLEGALKLRAKGQSERLRFAFDFLSSAEPEVSMDAYREFARADYADYREMAGKLPADKLAAWLSDAKTPPGRLGLYAMLLGHCGNAKHAELLLTMIKDPEKRRGGGAHGLMMAYTILEPDKGWKLVKGVAHEEEKPFLFRYAGLQTMRFLRECRPDVVNAKDDAAGRTEIIRGVADLMSLPDMADFAIEDLRRWKQWDYCGQVLKLHDLKSHDRAIISKSILRYALQCPTPQATAFVKAQRELDPKYVDETRELLELETPPAK